MPLSSALLAPGLQVGHQLVGRHVGARPQLAQFLAHRHQLGQRRAVAHGLGQLRLHGRAGSCRRRGAASAWPARMLVPARRCSCAPCAFRRVQLGAAGALAARGVLGHHLVAVGDDRLERLAVGHRLARRPASAAAASCAPWPGRPSPCSADVDPADVELVGLDRQLGRGRVGVVVVVQFLAADDDAPGRDVGRRVRRLEVAVAPPVAEAVDDAGGGDRDPQPSAPPTPWRRWRRTAAGR